MTVLHIADHVALTLIDFGWRNQDDGTYTKRIRCFAEAGTMSDGTRVVRLRLDDNGRWLERIDGWGNVERDVDLRDYASPRAAINAVLD